MIIDIINNIIIRNISSFDDLSSVKYHHHSVISSYGDVHSRTDIHTSLKRLTKLQMEIHTVTVGDSHSYSWRLRSYSWRFPQLQLEIHTVTVGDFTQRPSPGMVQAMAL